MAIAARAEEDTLVRLVERGLVSSSEVLARASDKLVAAARGCARGLSHAPSVIRIANVNLNFSALT